MITKTGYMRRRRNSGLTLVEVMVASALGGLVLACVGSLCMYGSRSSVALLNYTDLDSKSRYAADLLSREMRQATAVLECQTNSAFRKWVTLTNASDNTQ